MKNKFFDKICVFLLAFMLMATSSLFLACDNSKDSGGGSSDDNGGNAQPDPVSELPTLSFENEELSGNSLVMNVTNKNQIILPAYTAKDCYGNALSEDKIVVTHTLDGENDDSVTYNVGCNSKKYYAVGKHVFNFKLTDAQDASKTNSYNVYLNVYQSLFRGFSMSDVLDGELSDNPTVKSNNKGFGLHFFNMDRSSVYYAETTFDSVDTEARGASWGIGMVHTTEDDASYSLKDYYRIETNGVVWHRYSRGFVADSTIPEAYYATQGITYPAFSTAGNKITVGVARVNDMFYSFLNGKLVDKFSYSAISGRRTSAGICLIGNDKIPYPGTASNFKFITGDDALTIIREKEAAFNDFGYARVLNNKKIATFTQDSFAFDKLSDYSSVNWWDCAARSNVVFGGKTRVEFDLETLKVPAEDSSINIWIKKFDGSEDPTNSNGFYHGVTLEYSKGNILPNGAYPKVNRLSTAGYYEHLNELTASGTNRFESFQGFATTTAKMHVTILAEPGEGEKNGETKYTYTFTEVGVDNPQSVTFLSYATQAQSSVENEDNNELFYLAFTTEKVEYKVSNFTCTGLRVF